MEHMDHSRVADRSRPSRHNATSASHVLVLDVDRLLAGAASIATTWDQHDEGARLRADTARSVVAEILRIGAIASADVETTCLGAAGAGASAGPVDEASGAPSVVDSPVPAGIRPAAASRHGTGSPALREAIQHASDTELLDWLTDAQTDAIWLDDMGVIDVQAGDVRQAIAAFRARQAGPAKASGELEEKAEHAAGVLRNAAIQCGHRINDERVILERVGQLEGTAATQLQTRLAAAVDALALDDAFAARGPLVDALFEAALDCTHSVQDRQIVLYRSGSGHGNALGQLEARLCKALRSAARRSQRKPCVPTDRSRGSELEAEALPVAEVTVRLYMHLPAATGEGWREQATAAAHRHLRERCDASTPGASLLDYEMVGMPRRLAVMPATGTRAAVDRDGVMNAPHG